MASRPLVVTLGASICLMLGACAQVGGEGGGLASILGSAPASAPEAAPAATKQSELEKATSYWGKEFASNPRNVEAAVNYARNLKAMGEKDKAIAALQQASIYNSDHKGLASEYGRLALESDQVGLAEKLLARAEDPLKPDWRVLSAQGAALAKQGRHRDAIPLIERALTLSPDNPAVMNNLGMAHAMNGEAAKAEDILRKASAAPNANPRVRQNLALVLGLQGKFEEAKTLAAADLPPEKAQAAVAYLQKMVDAAPANAKQAPAEAKVAAAPRASKSAAKALKGGKPGKDADPAAVASSGWSTEVARAGAPIPLTPPAR
jgi:Flp pilus assembly protein TadD